MNWVVGTSLSGQLPEREKGRAAWAAREGGKACRPQIQGAEEAAQVGTSSRKAPRACSPGRGWHLEGSVCSLREVTVPSKAAGRVEKGLGLIILP